MIRLPKKTRLRLFLILLIPVIIIIVIFYSGVYTSNELKFSAFAPNDNNYHLSKISDNKDSVVEVNNDLSLNSDKNNRNINNNESNKPQEKSSILKFPWSQYNNDDHHYQPICNQIDSAQSIDINTIDDYQKLQFKPQYKTYWNYSYENNYLKNKENWQQLPLKVITYN